MCMYVGGVCAGRIAWLSWGCMVMYAYLPVPFAVRVRCLQPVTRVFFYAAEPMHLERSRRPSTNYMEYE